MALLAILAFGALVGVAFAWRTRDRLHLPIAGAVGGLLAGAALQIWADVWPGRHRGSGIGLIMPWFIGAILGAFLGTAVAAARPGSGGPGRQRPGTSGRRGAP